MVSVIRTSEEVSAKFRDIVRGVTATTTVKEMDEAIAELKSWLGGQSEPGILDDLAELRNAVVEREQADLQAKEAQRNHIETQNKMGLKSSF